VTVTLTLTTTSSVRMVACVHSQTSDGGPDVQPTTSTSLTQLSVLPCGVADHADGRRRIPLHPAYFTTLQSDNHTIRLVVPGDDGSICTGGATKHRMPFRRRAHCVDERSDWDHVQGEAVPSPGGPRGEHAGVDNTAHTGQKVIWNPRSVGLDHIPSAQAIRSEDVALLLRGLVGDERDVAAAAGVPLDAIDPVWARLDAVEVDGSDPPLVASSVMPHGDASGMVASALSVTLLGERERLEGAAFPQVLVDRAHQMSDSGSAWFVTFPDAGRKRALAIATSYTTQIGPSGFAIRACVLTWQNPALRGPAEV